MKKEYRFRFFGTWRSLFCDCSLQVDALCCFQNRSVAFIAKPLSSEPMCASRIACFDEVLGQFRVVRLLDEVLQDRRVWFVVCSSVIGRDAVLEAAANMGLRSIELERDGIKAVD